jgi:predicted DNA-binding protein YlxM (UPF0122 family)
MLLGQMPLHLDQPEARRRLQLLMDRYGGLLSARQRQVLSLHIDSDWSLAEIAELDGVSRPSVHESIARACQALERYERVVGALAREESLRGRIAGLERRLAARGAA